MKLKMNLLKIQTSSQISMWWLVYFCNFSIVFSTIVSSNWLGIISYSSISYKSFMTTSSPVFIPVGLRVLSKNYKFTLPYSGNIVFSRSAWARFRSVSLWSEMIPLMIFTVSYGCYSGRNSLIPIPFPYG